MPLKDDIVVPGSEPSAGLYSSSYNKTTTVCQPESLQAGLSKHQAVRLLCWRRTALFFWEEIFWEGY